MKITSIWTENEGQNIINALRKLYGEALPGTLVKYAVRDFVEIKRINSIISKNKQNKRK